MINLRWGQYIREDLFCDKPSHLLPPSWHSLSSPRNKINKPWRKLWLKVSFFHWMTMRIFIFIPRADWCGCNLPLQSVNIPVFVAVVQTSIVVYSMLHQNTEREGRDWTQYSETTTQVRARPLLEREREREYNNRLVLLWPYQRLQLIKTQKLIQQILKAEPASLTVTN